MEQLKHWTSRSVNDLVYSVASGFVAQIETKMEDEDMDRKTLADVLKVTRGRVSQVLNDPSHCSLRGFARYALAVGMKMSVLAYDDGDASNKLGLINAEVFSDCWRRCGRPRDLFELRGVGGTATHGQIDQSIYEFTTPCAPFASPTSTKVEGQRVTGVPAGSYTLTQMQTRQESYGPN